MPPELTKPNRAVVGGLCAAALVSALVGAVLAVRLEPSAWMWLGFEVVHTATAIIGLLIATGRFRDGPALAIACVAGTFFVGTVFGRVGVMADPSIGGLFRDPWIVGRTLLAGGLSGCATVAVLARSDRGWGLLIKGLIVCAMTVAALGVLWLTRGGWLMRSGTGVLEVLRVVAVFVIAALLAVGISVGAHLVIRAYESGRDGAPNGPKSAG